MTSVHCVHCGRSGVSREVEVVVAVLASAIAATNSDIALHARRVQGLSMALARMVSFDPRSFESLMWAALLHDLGKIGVPSSLLLKPGPLTPDEHQEVEKHIDIGARLLRQLGFDERTVRMVEYHEERWDGATTGRYPGRFGLKADEIPLGARIIAVADAFDAMTNDRPYRRAMSPAAAIAELQREAGGQFDPMVVMAFLRLVASPAWPRD